MAIQKTVINNSSNRNELLSKAITNSSNVVSASKFEAIELEPYKVNRTRIQKRTIWAYTDKARKICRQYGNMFLEFERDKGTVVFSDVDRANFVNVVKLACVNVREKYDKVSISMVLNALKENGITIVDREVLSSIVKKYLVDNPNPKVSKVGRKGYNRVRHNTTLLGQECPVQNNTITKRSIEFQRKLYAMSA